MRLPDINPVSNADFLITLEGLTEKTFTTFTGVEETYARPKFSDGLSGVNRTASTGRSEISEFTIGKPFDPTIDDDLLDFILEHKNGQVFDVTVRPVRRGRDLEFVGRKAFRLGNCRMMSHRVPGNVDTSSGDTTSTVEITAHPETAEWS